MFRSGLIVAGALLLSAAAAAQQLPVGAGAKGVTVLRAQPVAPPTAAVQPAVATPGAAPAPAPGAVSPMFAPCARPFAGSAATLGGGGGFDRAVTKALRRRPASAVVDIAQPFSVAGDPPAALAPWLNEVKASGGLVSASEYCRDSRGLFGWVGRMVRAVRGVSYRAADGYDAVLHVDGLEQKVTQVEFRRRAS